MPTPEEILATLSLAANKFMPVSILWHIIVLVVLITLLAGRKLNTKVVSAGLSIFLLSVGIIAVLVSNPFNAIIFALAALLFGFMTLKFKSVPVGLLWDPVSVFGLILLFFGLIYPHFLDQGPLYRYLYASPMGLIPCPTLSAFIGITMMLHGFGSKKWMLTAAIFGLFYGIFGVLKLKVYLDLGLIAGALFLLVYAFTIKKKVVVSS
jgi:hypothetical protein